MAASSHQLRLYLRNLAGWAWNKQGHAFNHGNGLCLHEETLTEMILLRMALDNKKHNLRVRMFNKHEERKNGADWEWFVKTAHCSHRLRVQAKRLYHSSVHAGYGGLDLKQVQHARLISHARTKGLTPVYVFYNHNHGKGSAAFPDNPTSEFRGKSHWGCSIMHAKHVTQNVFSTLQSAMQPWHELVGQNGSCGLNFQTQSSAAQSEVIGEIPADPPGWLLDWGNPDALNKYLIENSLVGVAELDFTDFRG